MSKIKQWLSTFLTVCLTLTLSVSLIAVSPAFADTDFTVYGLNFSDSYMILDLSRSDTECETYTKGDPVQPLAPGQTSEPVHIGMRAFCNDLTRGVDGIDEFGEASATLKLYKHDDCGLQNVEPTDLYPSAIPINGCTIVFESFES
ncbi:hypothetical protein BJP36_25545 [Moorena producens JHB]|uniref:Secreted protein n=1 Tax=Moorena producens (strain JHB) TaxID=1454205 RepID=A0A1D9G5S5_MOOP1|nr:hypothetical protein [Moorena producens]AOY82770.1 hypothetical protein BJP36_25545 [Moorena producens JHB]